MRYNERRVGIAYAFLNGFECIKPENWFTFNAAAAVRISTRINTG